MPDRAGQWSHWRVAGAGKGSVRPALLAVMLLAAPAMRCGGTGAATRQTPLPPTSTHSVLLKWAPSTSAVVGYNVYRATSQAGPYTRLNAAPVTSTQFRDQNVALGATYYYATTSINAQGAESSYSNLVTVTIPNS